MRNLFDMDGGIMGTLGKVADVMILSVIYIIFCIPVITIGAATTALYYTAVKAIRRGRSYIWRSFWNSFKENFVTSTLFWIAMVAASIILSINVWFCGRIGGTMGFVLLCIYGMMGFVIALTGAFIFPVISRFNLPKKNILLNSFFMAVRHLPFTVLMIIITAATIAGCLFIPPLVFAGPACGALVYSLPMEKILKKYTNASENENEDAWYLE